MYKTNQSRQVKKEALNFSEINFHMLISQYKMSILLHKVPNPSSLQSSLNTQLRYQNLQKANYPKVSNLSLWPSVFHITFHMIYNANILGGHFVSSSKG